MVPCPMLVILSILKHGNGPQYSLRHRHRRRHHPTHNNNNNNNTSTTTSVETRIARLYLLSDILFNAQQPGVKNAFRYRDAIERMAPAVFASLGHQHDNDVVGRMTRHKLQTAVASVVAAWTSWSVFDTTFLDELTARFEGREIPKTKEEKEKEEEALPPSEKEEEEEENKSAEEEEKDIVTFTARGDWTEVEEDSKDTTTTNIVIEENKKSKQTDDDSKGEQEQQQQQQQQEQHVSGSTPRNYPHVQQTLLYFRRMSHYRQS
mmetsp:Transcript_20839/g.31404  ORF Transcript_20839/g.31404 Transcript_20839/m.31404 type:complete len:263 (-) Transcript_20839:1462-2250(-)